ncbi:MAG: cytochrome c biogenesis protein CcsA [Sedimentisphaerales bacterium]|nr:cytochrome c biogenesis protein CcsA [Sedimentisphaerales bacterium]
MRSSLLLITMVLLLVSCWIALTKGRIEGPSANPDSPVRNIIYAHVPSSVCSLVCFTILLITSLGYLITSKEHWDHIAAACAEVGMIFATILNATGMFFSRAEWGPWWAPTPRLVSSAVLWFLYVVYLILRSSLPGSKKRRAGICAVFGIIAFLDVPMVYISARYMKDIHQAGFTFDNAWQRGSFIMAMASTVLLAAMLIWIRTDVLKIKSRLEA